ncbi:MAG: WD40 repeat domain-containing protein [Aestuariivirgaceae bacterium]
MNTKILIAVAILLGLAAIGYSLLGSNSKVEFAARLGSPGDHSETARLPELPMYIDFDQANGRIVSKQDNGDIVAWDIKSGARTELAKTRGLFAFCRDQQLLLLQEKEGVVLLDLKTGNRQLINEDAYHHAAWSKDCSAFAIANQDDSKVKRWLMADLSNHIVIPTGRPVRNGIAISHQGNFIAAAEGTYTEKDGHKTKLEVFKIDDKGGFSRRSPKEDGPTILGMWTMAFAPDSQTLVVGSQKNSKSGLRALTTDSVGERWRQTDFASYWVRAIAISPDGKFLASGDEKGWLRIWDAANGSKLNEVQTGLVIQAASFSDDGGQLAIALWDSTIGILDLQGF